MRKNNSALLGFKLECSNVNGLFCVYGIPYFTAKLISLLSCVYTLEGTNGISGLDHECSIATE